MTHDDKTQAALEYINFERNWLTAIHTHDCPKARSGKKCGVCNCGAKEYDNHAKNYEAICHVLTEAAELKAQIKGLSEIIDSQKQTHDALIKMNEELLETLKHLRHNIKALGIKSSDLGLAMDFANETIARAEKGTSHD